MNDKTFKINILSGNVLKIFASICMVLDHIGSILLPEVGWLRIIGRLAFPIFAFMIAEGTKYTKNKFKYFMLVFIIGTIYQMIFLIIEKDLRFNILITFTLSILMIYALQYFKSQILSKNTIIFMKILSGLIFVISVVGVYVLNRYLIIDYGFFGCMLPVVASAFHYTGENNTLKSLDNKYLSLLLFALCLIIMSFVGRWVVQFYSLLAIPLLLLYSEERGKYNLKYFFYVFYPVHLIVLYLIRFIV